MVKNRPINSQNLDQVKSSWAKDYVVLFIGFTLVLLSNFSNLNKDTDNRVLINVEENISIEKQVIAKRLSNLIKEDI